MLLSLCPLRVQHLIEPSPGRGKPDPCDARYILAPGKKGPKEVFEMEREFEKLISEAEASGAVVEIEGVKMVNCTPHPLRFEDDRVINGNKELAAILKATPREKTVKTINDIELVTPQFLSESQGEQLCNYAKEQGFLLIGSIIAAQAYRKPVVSPVTTPETTRAPPTQRVIQRKKWTCYW